MSQAVLNPSPANLICAATSNLEQMDPPIVRIEYPELKAFDDHLIITIRQTANSIHH